MSLSKKYMKEICKIGQGAHCCRYLICGSKGFECAKLHQDLMAALDMRVASGTMTARGDNCEGKLLK